MIATPIAFIARVSKRLVERRVDQRAQVVETKNLAVIGRSRLEGLCHQPELVW
jgi:hypothetical protein